MRSNSKKNKVFSNKITEDNRIFRTNLENIVSSKKIRTILISSSVNGEGKTSIISDLASSFSNKKSEKILIIDCNFEKPMIAQKFKLENNNGIINYFNDEISLKNCINKINDYVDVITAGNFDNKVVEMLSSPKIKLLINDLKDTYNIIIFDSSAVLETADSQIISRIADGTILVLNPNKVSKKQVLQARKNLMQSGAKIIGIVLNNCSSKHIID